VVSWLAFWTVTVIAFFAILFTIRYPKGLFDFNVLAGELLPLRGAGYRQIKPDPCSIRAQHSRASVAKIGPAPGLHGHGPDGLVHSRRRNSHLDTDPYEPDPPLTNQPTRKSTAA
jgi:hypothetical protein